MAKGGRRPLPFAKPSSKLKKDAATTYSFELKIEESNEDTYPEYSWKDLVTAEKLKSRPVLSSSSKGQTSREMCLSDDEEFLKATVAKLEEKYKAGQRARRKRRKEDYIDRGAGYDEEDSFIDNSDAYDEIVPAEIETARGGFYVNSGTLDFKEVDVSEEEEEDEESISNISENEEPIDVDEDSSEVEAAKENKKVSNGNNQSIKNDVMKQPPRVVSPQGSSTTASKATLRRRSILKPKRNKSGKVVKV